MRAVGVRLEIPEVPTFAQRGSTKTVVSSVVGRKSARNAGDSERIPVSRGGSSFTAPTQRRDRSTRLTRCTGLRLSPTRMPAR